MSLLSLPLSLSPARRGAVVIAVLLLGWVWYLGSGRSGFSLLSGAVFGLLLQRSRFCFFCVTRDFIERKIPDGLLGLLAALVVGTLGYHAVLGAFLPDPSTGRLPPDAHIGPVSWVLALAATVFGIGMALSGSCISAHLYRLGEGALASLAALAGILVGFGLGFASWNSLYLSSLQEAPVVWLPTSLGYGGSLILQLLLLGGVAAWLLSFYRPATETPEVSTRSLFSLLFGQRWPTWVGGLLIGTLAIVAYLRVGPLGVTAELGSLARTGANALGWLPERLEGLDSFAGCATQLKETLLSDNGLFVIGLILASWTSALTAGDFKLSHPTSKDWIRNALGGVLLGWGSMLALGCTVGTLLSGIMAGALSGWVFALFCLMGAWIGLKLRGVFRLG